MTTIVSAPAVDGSAWQLRSEAEWQALMADFERWDGTQNRLHARRMVIENTIADAIDFFHMDALSAAVPMRIDLDVQLTLMASSLYRLLGIRVGQGFEVAKARTIFRKLVHASAAIRITGDEIIVTLGRRANNPLLIAARYEEIAQPIPWLGNRTLRIRFL